ncbi:MAG: Sporulation-specific N-acetylmuramoyl-L-alanine amidase [Chlamydiales bacterium]|nr:Sporulation-specific N-acetylmuramoyl-L-alanine amidase [Chlamydiales bacterium]
MRALLLLGLVLVVSGCSYRGISPEVSRLSDEKQTRFTRLHKPEVIIVDAGHGGKDGGTGNKGDAIEEKELTLETAFLIRNCLHQLGYKTVMTRTHDIYVPLSTRAEIANNVGADLFVSIHYNHAASKEAKGVEVFYYKEGKSPPSQRITESKNLAGSILKRVIANTGAESRGLKEANFAVIRETQMPAILIEAGFLSNPIERERVRDPKYQHSIAWGIARGIDQYCESMRTKK